MTFNNSKTIISLRIRLFVATVVFLIYIILTYVTKLIKYPLLGMSDTTWTLILIGIYFFIAFLPVFLSYQYVSYSDEGDSIIIRYFFSGIVGGKKNSIEISKETFAGYEIESKLFGLKQSLVLFQRMKEGAAKYPPVHISSLTREEKSKILASLNKFVPRV